MKCDEADFEILALEGAAFGRGPFYAVLCHGNFDVGAVGYSLDKVEELADFVLVLARRLFRRKQRVDARLTQLG